ncbi:MAG TPA: exodeoxyribonuclease VII large subunit [Candidatus Dormibacteraeota bacterium]|jgi:exodeoxyribonuclease VII large subunit|nr:exodeoxyribonuclease VII large subunit [Candidatus Dormibacteraeota bacterium]
MDVRSVTWVNDLVLETVSGESRLQDLWVEGEVTEVKVSNQGHCYLTLKDPESRLRCALFRRAFSAVRFEIQPGMTLLLHGKVEVYRDRGEVQMIADRAQPSGSGDLHLAFEQLRRRLEAQGLFDQRLKRRPPAFPRRVAVVTSSSGAALRDVVKVLGRRCPVVPVLVAHAAVQGENAQFQLVRALRQVAQRPGVEVVLLVRGGGSIEDLASFNDEGLARAIRACPVPVIVGVGHETDFTIADFAADLRAPTPSAAAEMAVPDLAELRRGVLALRQRLDLAVRREATVKGERLDGLRHRLERQSPARLLPALRQRLDDRLERLQLALRTSLDRAQRHLAADRARLEALSPLAVLARGYSLARDEAGRVVTSIADLAVGQRLLTVFADGIAVGEVHELRPAASRGGGSGAARPDPGGAEAPAAEGGGAGE